MVRPCFLVIDREYASTISSRKLVIETAKMNVITAYSSAEAVATFRKFPNIDGVVMDANTRDCTCDELCNDLRAIQPELVIVAITAAGQHPCAGANHKLDSFDPKALLELLHTIEPVAYRAIEAHEKELSLREH